MLLSKPQELELEYFEHTQAIENLIKIVEEKGNPELINDNPETAPSKRIIELIPEYECNKVSVGASIVGIIGIEWLKTTCKHFNDWLLKLEQL